MTGFTSMIKLDLFTMKSQSVSYLSLLAIVLLFAFMGSSVITLCITGAWFIALMSVNIFAIQEKTIWTVYTDPFPSVCMILYWGVTCSCF